MKFLFLTLLLVAVAMAAVTDQWESVEEDCPENEDWSDCMKGCEYTCENELDQRQGFHNLCSSACYPGCVCSKGWARSGDSCVEASECPIPEGWKENLFEIDEDN